MLFFPRQLFPILCCQFLSILEFEYIVRIFFLMAKKYEKFNFEHWSAPSLFFWPKVGKMVIFRGFCRGLLLEKNLNGRGVVRSECNGVSKVRTWIRKEKWKWKHLVIIKYEMGLGFFWHIQQFSNTICPGSSDPFYTYSYYITWVTTPQIILF